MTERLDSSSEQINEGDRFATERAVQALFDMLRVQGTELAALRFATVGEAKIEGVQFAKIINELATKIGDISTVKIRVSGPEVAYSNIDVTRVDDKITGLEVDVETPYCMADPFDELKGYYYDSPLLPDEDENGYFITPYLILQNSVQSDLRTDDDLPLAKLAVQSYIKAPITNETDIDVPKLIDYEARRLAIGRVALTDLERQNEIRAALGGLEEAFEATVSRKFLRLENIGLLHTIGRVTASEADLENVVDALRQVFGRERLVKLKAMAYEGTSGHALDRFEISGKVLDILSSHELLQVSEVLLVVECQIPNDEGEEPIRQLYYVPLSGIETLSY